MKTLLQLFILLSVFTLAAAAQQKAAPEAMPTPAANIWREVMEPQRGFKISLPSEPSRNVERQSGDYQMHAYGDDLACLILHLRGPEVDEREAETEEFWKGFSREVAGDTDAQILSETPIRFEGHPGREYRLKIGDVLTVGRIYVVGREAYCLFVADMTAQDASPKTARFLNSFRLTSTTPVSLPSTELVAKVKFHPHIGAESILRMCGEYSFLSEVLSEAAPDAIAPGRARIPVPQTDLRASVKPVAFQPVMLEGAFQKLLIESSPMAVSSRQRIKLPALLSPASILNLPHGPSPVADATEVPAPPKANRQ